MSIERHIKDILGDKIELIVEDGKYHKIYLKSYQEFDYKDYEEFEQRNFKVVGVFARCTTKLEPQLLVLAALKPSIECNHNRSA
jgi:hypothetical protein